MNELTERTVLDVELMFLSSSDGGRKTIPSLEGRQYRPNIAVATLEEFRKAPNRMQYGVVFLEAPVNVQFDERCKCTLWLWAYSHEAAKEFAEVMSGRPFVLTEGTTAVGYGEILSRREERCGA